jgi:MFS family permease
MADGSQTLLAAERRAVGGLAGILVLRMLGFYAILPVLSAYAASLPDARALWIGLVVGIYGLTQALFQIPFGAASDRYGRRLVIVIGLLVFALGSFVAGSARSVLVLGFGRALQGAGAFASALIAFAADLTRPEVRTRAMAYLGTAIGLSFGIGFVIGPPAAARFGVPWMFHATGVLAVLAIAYVVTLPKANPSEASGRLTWPLVMEVLRRHELILLNLGVLAVHLGLTFLFVVFPIEIERLVPRGSLWKIYLPVISIGLLLMLLAARRAEHPAWARPILWTGTSLLALSWFVLALLPSGLDRLVLGLFLFTCGMALTEPILPAFLTRFAPAEIRGTAAGVFNVHQFLGAFLGGWLGGTSLALGLRGLCVIVGLSLLVWTLLARRLPNPLRVEIARRQQERRRHVGSRRGSNGDGRG